MSASQVILKCGASEYFLPNASKKVETLLELIQGAIESMRATPRDASSRTMNSAACAFCACPPKKSSFALIVMDKKRNDWFALRVRVDAATGEIGLVAIGCD